MILKLSILDSRLRPNMLRCRRLRCKLRGVEYRLKKKLRNRDIMKRNR